MAAAHRFLRILLVLFALGLVGCDHATKLAAKATLEGAAAVPIAPGTLGGLLELRYVENDDIAFSVFHRLGLPRSPIVFAGLALTAVAILVGVVALSALRRRRAAAATGAAREVRPGLAHAGWALVFGGAVGNLIDRLVRGYVVDFIHLRGWPVFNVADIAVVVGFGLLLLGRLIEPRSRGGPGLRPPASGSWPAGG